MAPRRATTEIALLMRTSTDMGVTWSPPRAILPRFTLQQMPVGGTMFRASNGFMILPCDWYAQRLATVVSQPR